jgi:hypothetical protein
VSSGTVDIYISIHLLTLCKEDHQRGSLTGIERHGEANMHKADHHQAQAASEGKSRCSPSLVNVANMVTVLPQDHQVDGIEAMAAAHRQSYCILLS